MRYRVLICLSILSLACACAGPTVSRAGAGSSATTPVPSREPADLPRFAEEQTVLQVLTASGMRVELIGASKFETLLGTPRRTRVFIGTLQGSRVGAEVLFLDAPAGDVRVCKTAGSAYGFTKVVITVDGAPGSSGEGSQSMNFAVSDRYFVMSSDVRVRDALRDGLGLSEPRC